MTLINSCRFASRQSRARAVSAAVHLRGDSMSIAFNITRIAPGSWRGPAQADARIGLLLTTHASRATFQQSTVFVCDKMWAFGTVMKKQLAFRAGGVWAGIY